MIAYVCSTILPYSPTDILDYVLLILGDNGVRGTAFGSSINASSSRPLKLVLGERDVGPASSPLPLVFLLLRAAHTLSPRPASRRRCSSAAAA